MATDRTFTEVEIVNKVALVAAGHKMAGFDVIDADREVGRAIIAGELEADDEVARLIGVYEQQRRASVAAASVHSAALEGQHLAPADADDSAAYVRGEITLGELAERTRQRHGVA